MVYQPKPFPFLCHCVLCLRTCITSVKVSINSSIDLVRQYTCLTCFWSYLLSQKTDSKTDSCGNTYLLQSSVTFFATFSILSVLLACALTSCCLPMCHKFIMVLFRHYFFMLLLSRGSLLSDYVALTSMCTCTSFNSSYVSYPAAPSLDSSLLFSTWDFEHWTDNH